MWILINLNLGQGYTLPNKDLEAVVKFLTLIIQISKKCLVESEDDSYQDTFRIVFQKIFYYNKPMNPKARQYLTLCHVIFAGLFLPIGIVFIVTGGLYTFGVKGKYKEEVTKVNSPLSQNPSLDDLILFAKANLQNAGVKKLPTGDPALKKVGTSWIFEWTGVRLDYTIEPTETEGLFKSTVKHTNAHRFFVQMHKAKGGLPIKILAGGLALGLIFLFFSGVLMAFSSPRLKKVLLNSLGLGITAFVFASLFS